MDETSDKIAKTQGNLFDNIPMVLDEEMFDALVDEPGLGIRRILSQGQTTPWLEQDENEWVVLLAGAAKILFDKENREVTLKPGDYLVIPANCRHRVSWTDPAKKTVWLAVHYT